MAESSPIPEGNQVSALRVDDFSVGWIKGIIDRLGCVK